MPSMPSVPLTFDAFGTIKANAGYASTMLRDNGDKQRK
jgi:hypothetical protein